MQQYDDGGYDSDSSNSMDVAGRNRKQNKLAKDNEQNEYPHINSTSSGI